MQLVQVDDAALQPLEGGAARVLEHLRVEAVRRLLAAGADATAETKSAFLMHPAGSTARDIAERATAFKNAHNWGDAFWKL